MTPVVSLTKPHVDKLAGFAEPAGSPGEEETERRAQELLNEWFKRYFGGMVFQTPVGNGTTEAKQFEQCEILWDQATPTNPATLPILHLMLADRNDGEPVLVSENLWRNHGRWTWNALVRVPPQRAVNSVAVTAEDAAVREASRVCRRAADQCRWLLASAHLQELAEKGIGHLVITNGPRMISGGQWHLRQLVFTAEVTWHHRSNMP